MILSAPLTRAVGNVYTNFDFSTFFVFELRQALAFIAEKFRGSRDPGHAPFWKKFWGLVRTIPGNTCVKFEVRSFNRFWAISI